MPNPFFLLDPTPGTADNTLQKVAPDIIRVLKDNASPTPDSGNLEIAGPRPWVDVRAFGATGVGTGDDAPKFQDAVNALPNGGLILVPEGNYRFNSIVDVKYPISFVGTNRESCKLILNGGRKIKAGSSDVTFRNLTFQPTLTNPEANTSGWFVLEIQTSPTVEYSNWRFDQCTIENLRLTFTRSGRKIAGATALTSGTQVTSDISVVDCIFRNCAVNYALEFSGIAYGLVDRCLFADNKPAAAGGALRVSGTSPVLKVGGELDYQRPSVLITNSTFRENNFSGINLYDCNQATVSYCVIENNGKLSDPLGHGINIQWRNFTPPDPVNPEDSSMDRFIISCNRVRGNGQDGLHINAPRVICTGNQVEENGTGTIGDGISVNVNEFGSPANKPTEECIIAHNICRLNKASGINVGMAQKVQVTGNQCHGNTGVGIKAIAPSGSPTNPGNIFSGNICYGNHVVGGIPDPNSGISVAGDKHILSANLTQDTNGSTVGTGNFIQRDGYGQTSGVPIASDWPVGVIVCNISANPDTFYLRVPSPTDWVEIDMV